MNIFNPSRVRLLKEFESLQRTYKQSQPCPHLLIDNLFNPKILDYVLNEFPINYEQEIFNCEITGDLTVEFKEVKKLSDFARTFYFWLNSQDFINAFSLVIDQEKKSLIGDPLLCDAGLYEILPGGQLESLESNDDIILHPNFPLICQFNLIICLNKYGISTCGEKIEIYSSQDLNQKVSYIPRFNRTIILPMRGKHRYRIMTCDCSERSSKFLSIYYWSLIPM